MAASNRAPYRQSRRTAAAPASGGSAPRAAFVGNRHPADHHERRLRDFAGQPADQLDVDPPFDQAREADDRPRYVGQFGRRRQRIATGAGEVIEVHAVGHQHGVRVQRAAALEHRLGCGNHQVGGARQPVVHRPHRLGVDAGQGGIVVDAVIDDRPRAQVLDEAGDVRDGAPRDRSRRAERSHRPLRGRPTPAAVEPGHRGRAGAPATAPAS